MTDEDSQDALSVRRAQVVGIGMVGGSIAAALRERGWHVTGHDIDETRAKEAEDRGLIDATGIAEDVEITFVATPVSTIPAVAIEALGRGGIVTDVGSVKGAVIERVSDRRFVGGHPMAGSEHSGLEGVNADLFVGATWVLTPDETTDPEVYIRVRGIVSLLGADVVTLPAGEHDEIVATISHVPHLVASALMETASSRSLVHETMLRLAAGGFRDMTRIAAGHPTLWTDIALANRRAIVDGIDRLQTALEELRGHIANEDREALERGLSGAALARRNLPLRPQRPADMSLMRIPIPDRPGSLGEVLGIFGAARSNVEDLQIAHDPKGDRGVLEVSVATASVENVRVRLESGGFQVAVEAL